MIWVTFILKNFLCLEVKAHGLLSQAEIDQNIGTVILTDHDP